MYIYVYRKISTIRVGKYTDIPWIRGLEPCFGMKNFNFWEAFYGCDSHAFLGAGSKKWRFFRWFVFFSWDGELVGGWTNPIWKICSSNWIISPGKVKNKKCLKPPPSFSWDGGNFRNFKQKNPPIHEFDLLWRRGTWRTTRHPRPIPREGTDAQDLSRLPPKIKLGSKVGIPVGVSYPNIYYISTIIGDDEITHFKQTHWWLKSWQEWFCVANWRFRLGSPILKSENPGGDYDKPRGTQHFCVALFLLPEKSTQKGTLPILRIFLH